MNQKKKKPQFRKSVDWNSANKQIPPKNNVSNQNTKNKKILEQRHKAKMELINKYNMSEEEAEETLRNIEKKAKKPDKKILEQRHKAKMELINKYNMSEEEAEETLRNIERKARKQKKEEVVKKEIKKSLPENEDYDVIIPIHMQEKENKIKNENTFSKPAVKTSPKKEENVKQNDKFDEKQNLEKKDKDIKKETNAKEENQISKEDNEKLEKKAKQNVDDLVNTLIPINEKELSIELNDVSLTFEVEKDKIDNLKEYFIRTIKRNKEKRAKFQVLKDINLKIYKGEKVGIIGYNGAGKSTLLNVITGIYPPETGEVKTYGKISPLLGLGAGFDYNYTGKENIYLNGAILGYEKKFLKSKYDEIVEFSELREFIDIPVKNYSSGMLAKLGFSIATIVEPDILIIDEVLGVGDVNFRKKSSDKIRSLMDKGTTVLLVSHSIPQIRQLCDKAIWINRGEIVEIGEVNEVCNHYLKDAEKATKEQLKDIRFR